MLGFCGLGLIETEWPILFAVKVMAKIQKIPYARMCAYGIFC